MEGSYFVGQTATLTHAFSQADVEAYAALSGDNNPVHVDAEYAAGTRFGRRIVHGMLTAGLISTVMGNRLPGPGTIYVQQNLRFLAPVRMGDTITAEVEVSEITAEKNRVLLATRCVNQNGETVLDGEALVSPPKAT